MAEIKLALLGVGGFAANYLHAMEKPRREGVRLVGAVDPFVKACALCPVYASTQALYSAHQPDVVIVATPIQFHVEQAVEAFEHGCHVVMEKPIAATLEGANAILRARDKAGKKLSIGFQLCFDPAIRALKEDADAGRFGAPISLRAMVLWPRDQTYYQRGCGWAGKKFDAQGRPIYDSVLSNATAHYLMNMLHMVGAPVSAVQCATYRANPIETFDTAVLKATCGAGAELFIAVSHAVDRKEEQHPLFEYAYEGAILRFGSVGARGVGLTAQFTDGRVAQYGDVGLGYMENLWNMIDAIREGVPIGCPGETARLHVEALEKMRAVQPDATPFPEGFIAQTDGLRWVPGLAQALFACYEQKALPRWDMQAHGL